jgi:hypothetical protein
MATERRNKIGTFEGTPVYKISAPSFIGNKYYLDDKNIYLVNGELVRNNVVFASYNGEYVNDYPKSEYRNFFHEEPVKAKPVETPAETTEPMETYEAGTADYILASVYSNNLESLMYND